MWQERFVSVDLVLPGDIFIGVILPQRNSLTTHFYRVSGCIARETLLAGYLTVILNILAASMIKLRLEDTASN
ncbi:hypothetical protein D3C74_287660 [compost metagenome]